jgi:hypothetical protein
VRSCHNEETHSEEEFTSFEPEELPLMHLFRESNEEITDNIEGNNPQTVPTNMSYSENSEFKQTSAGNSSTPSEDVEEEPKLKPQYLLIWTLEHNKFERFSSLLEAPVDPKFK